MKKKMQVILEWDSDKLSEGWMNADNLRTILYSNTHTSEDLVSICVLNPIDEDTELEKPPRKIDHVCLQGWQLSRGGTHKVYDKDDCCVNSGTDTNHRHIRSGLILNAPGAIRALICYVDDYRAGKEITDRFADEFTKIITDAGFECDLR